MRKLMELYDVSDEFITCLSLHRVSVIDFATGIAPKEKSQHMNGV